MTEWETMEWEIKLGFGWRLEREYSMCDAQDGQWRFGTRKTVWRREGLVGAVGFKPSAGAMISRRWPLDLAGNVAESNIATAVQW